jgi:alpha-methylacyl-CoA racemase
MTKASGPLCGYKLIEIAGIGPTQLTGMLLADMGAEIIRIDRLTAVDLGVAMPSQFNLMNRSRPSATIDLKHPDGVKTVLKLCENADALFEGFRPGVMERLGLGP